MNGIGKEEVALFVSIALCGLVGFTVHSCNKASVVNNDIEERQHEFDVKNPEPCKDYTIDITSKRGECKPGTMPAIKYAGHGHDEQAFLFCTCPAAVEAKQQSQHELPFGELPQE